jgi:thioesterase domain-containing protein
VDIQLMDAELMDAAQPTVEDKVEFDEAALQRRIVSEFPLARHIGIEVECADDRGVTLSAALAPNANYKGSAFGGSLFSVAVLTGWAWVTRYLIMSNLAADAVIQESTIRYRYPVHGVLRAKLVVPPSAQIDKFKRMLLRAGRGRIRLAVNIHHGEHVATEFEGDFAATVRKSET